MSSCSTLSCYNDIEEIIRTVSKVVDKKLKDILNCDSQGWCTWPPPFATPQEKIFSFDSHSSFLGFLKKILDRSLNSPISNGEPTSESSYFPLIDSAIKDAPMILEKKADKILHLESKTSTTFFEI